MEINKIHLGDCLEIMPTLKDESFDLILCDLPYSTSSCSWDTLIPFPELWGQYERLIKQKGAIVLFGQEPFSSALRLSNIKLYKYDWIWVKSKVGNFLNAKNSPMKKSEDVIVFSKSSCANGAKSMMNYYPQGLVEINKNCSNTNKSRKGTTIEERPSRKNDYIQKWTNYPNNILQFKSESGLHPTQKPVKLLEYLLKTYTKEGDLVLDNAMGSGSVPIAAINTNRNFIGIEKDENYFNITKERLENKYLELIFKGDQYE